MVMEELMRTGDSGNGVVQELSPKEMDEGVGLAGQGLPQRYDSRATV